MWFYVSDNKRNNCEYSKNLALCLEETGRRVRDPSHYFGYSIDIWLHLRLFYSH